MIKRALIIVVLAAVSAAGAIAPSTASARPFLPMWKGKQRAREDLRYLVSRGEDLTMRCWRVSRRAIDCELVHPERWH